MSRIYTATYDASRNVLLLDEPLEGVKDGERVLVTILSPQAEAPPPNLTEPPSKE